MANSNSLRQFSDDLVQLVGGASGAVFMLGYDEGAPRSGVQITEDHIVTVARWADPGEEVSLYNSQLEQTTVKVAGYDMTSGVAILEHRGTPLQPSGNTPPVAVGALSVAIALPSKDGIEARLGMVRCVGGETRLPRGRRVNGYVQTDTLPFPGFMGGPLLDADGGLLGITMAGGHGGDGFVLPVSDLIEIVDRLKERPSIGRGYLGVVTQPAPVAQTVSAKINGQQSGLLVTQVEDDSPAGTAGVLVGDILLSLDGARIEAPEDLIDALIGKNDQSVELTLSRGEAVQKVTIQASHVSWNNHGGARQIRKRIRRGGHSRPGGGHRHDYGGHEGYGRGDGGHGGHSHGRHGHGGDDQA